MNAQFETELTDILQSIFGTAVWDDSANDTARRVLKAWQEFTPQAKPDFKFTTFPAKRADGPSINQQIVVRDIQFSSLCAHHLFPFYGIAHVGYIPNQKLVGLSKIPRLVHHFATKPTTQETLTAEIAQFMKHELEAMGVAVILESRHTCMSCRVVRAPSASMSTSEMRGVYLTSGEARTEFMQMVMQGHVL